MSNPALQPRHTERVVDPRTGIVTKAWADYFLRLSTQQSSDDLAQLYQQLAGRVSELEEGGALGFQIFGQDSIILDGSTQPGSVLIITLAGDQEAPGSTMFYGTGPAGVKGWYAVADALLGTAGQIVKTVGVDGVATLSLASEVLASLELADSAVQEVVAGAGISVDNTDLQRPVVSATASGGFVPFFIPDGETFTVPANAQALFTLPIELGDGSSIVLDGALVEVS